MLHLKPETKTLTMPCTINHFFSLLLPLRRQTSFLSRMFGIRSSSSFSMFPPCIEADRIVYPTSLYSGSSSRVACDWTPPLRVPCVIKYIKSYRNSGRSDHYNSSKSGCCPRLVVMNLHGVSVDSEKELYAFYINTLGYALGSEEEAKRRIYLVSHGCCYAFGAKIGFEAAQKLKGLSSVFLVYGDLDHCDRNEDPNDEPDAPFAPMNLNFRLNNIFSYHHLSERNSKWNSDHWLISTKKFNGVRPYYFDKICVKLLTEVVGSKKKTMKKIYAVWYDSPPGFGAKIDEEDAMKLQGMDKVFKVFPDYAFDVKGRCFNVGSVLNVKGPPYDLTFSSYHSNEESESKDCLVSGVSNGSRLIRQNPPPISQRRQYYDIYSYHYMNGVKSDWRSDRWVFHIKEQDDEFSNEQQIINFFIRLLAEVLGSEKDAKRKMYIMWCKLPFGFGAEVDEETANKLKALEDVLQVLPDYGSRVNRTMSDGLVISRSPFKDRNFSSRWIWTELVGRKFKDPYQQGEATDVKDEVWVFFSHAVRLNAKYQNLET